MSPINVDESERPAGVHFDVGWEPVVATWRWIRFPLMLALTMTAVVVALLIARFGSTMAAVAALDGSPIITKSRFISLGKIPTGGATSFTHVVTNLTSKDVTVVGANVSCPCLRALHLPQVIRARESATLSFEMSIPDQAQPGPIRQQVLLYLDEPGPRLTLEANANIVPRPST